jgi:uncharacterized protein (DUF488 family)
MARGRELEMNLVFTVGHSTRSLPEFTELLRSERVDMVVDVRSMPRSRRNPEYNIDCLPASLTDSKIGYEHIAELGGRRGKTRGVPQHTNGFWENQSFHNYADFAFASESFAAGLAKVIKLSAQRRCAILCAEAVWWRCHRRIIADYLIAQGHTVLHLMAANHVVVGQLTSGAELRGDRVVYPQVDAAQADDARSAQ